MKYLSRILLSIGSLVVIFLITTLLLFGHRDLPLTDLKAKYANSNSSFIAVEGINVHFRDEGNKNDTIPIVLIHGTAASLHTFDAWSTELTKNHRMIRMDLPAYGLTGPFANRDYSIQHYTRFLKQFLDKIKVKKCILAGNSLGGEIAWNYALEQPKMVEKLILIDAAGYPLLSKSVPIAFKIGRTPIINKVLTYITPRFIVKASIENIYFDKSKVTSSLIDRYYELTLRAGNRQAFVDHFTVIKDSLAYKKIKQISQPTLVLWGAEDLLIPVSNATKFHKDIPNNLMQIVSKSGHTPMEESPLESLKPVLNFIKTKDSMK
ncbi:alpha/beta hydrolase [Flavobacterium sp.]|uniref:alpha/beta fold hydrolase n=1 Tax=Flavobacterium sp. TaxID=239 RepID=UPI002609AD4B|nr:alpha/beta hydrolase [Flavobacterium sp.]MDG2432509.1 alpha/beta hydrolase [Flavobacterium sp.]